MLCKAVVELIPHGEVHGWGLPFLGKSGLMIHPYPDGMGAILDNAVDIEWNEVQRALRETAPTGLVARQFFFLQQENRPPGPGQFISQQAPGGSGADNDDIVKGLITF